MKRPERQERLKTVKTVKVCPKCAAFMLQKSQFGRDGETPTFSSDNQHRSFGGLELRTFECEKCKYSAQYQVDPFPSETFDE